MVRLQVDPIAPEVRHVHRAAEAIESAGIVAMPTDTFYGLAADPFSLEAVRRIFEIKSREPDRPLPLIGADIAQIERWLGVMSLDAARLAERFWPGPMTLLVIAPPGLAHGVASATGRVGVRVPAHAVARALCRAADTLLTATSANVSGQPSTADPDGVAKSLGDRVDVLLDGGQTAGGLPSTVVDVTGDEPRLIRPGAISWEKVLACVRVE